MRFGQDPVEVLKTDSFGHAFRYHAGAPANANDIHAQRMGPQCQRLADVAESDDEEGLTVQFEDAATAGVVSPLMKELATDQERKPAGEREHHRQKMLGDVGGMDTAVVGEDD